MGKWSQKPVTLTLLMCNLLNYNTNFLIQLNFYYRGRTDRGGGGNCFACASMSFTIANSFCLTVSNLILNKKNNSQAKFSTGVYSIPVWGNFMRD